MLLVIAALAALVAQQPQPLSAFGTAKARALLRGQLPCLGCHQLDGEGGRIGPDLSDVGSRLAQVEIYAMIANPGAARPGTLMPRIPMSDATRRLVARYLASRRMAVSAPESLRPAAVGTQVPPAAVPMPELPARGARLYARNCVACHGAKGRGDGPNAEFLPVRPANHTDREAMGRRTDDRLFDAIAAGGAPLGRSPRMPAFGLTLNHEEVRALVRHIRGLCRCEGPTWSRDGAPP